MTITNELYHDFFNYIDNLIQPVVIPDIGNIKGKVILASDVLLQDHGRLMDDMFDEWVKNIREAGL